LKPAVALGGMDCETVVDAATDAAEEVDACALATATRTEAAMRVREGILTEWLGGGCDVWVEGALIDERLSATRSSVN
jgi:hypothetical protein